MSMLSHQHGRSAPGSLTGGRAGRWGLALVEAAIAYEWLVSALNKILDPQFGGGLAMLSVSDPDGHHTGRMVLLYAMALLPVSLLPTLLGVTGSLYFYGALLLGLAYAGVSVALTRATTTARAWRVFLVSIVYLPALLTLMVVDKVLA